MARTARLASIDMLRGLVIVLMALDHVRDYFGPATWGPEQLDQTTPAWFFTRWITHLCAPTFVLLAGTSAYLYGVRRSKAELAFFLLTRGIWLVVAELRHPRPVALPCHAGRPAPAAGGDLDQLQLAIRL